MSRGDDGLLQESWLMFRGGLDHGGVVLGKHVPSGGSGREAEMVLKVEVGQSVIEGGEWSEGGVCLVDEGELIYYLGGLAVD